MPYIIGVAGSVAAGKSTFCRVMQALLARWPNTPRVELVTTDGFLFPNALLERDGLMGKKGFPESYDGAALLRFISDIKAGRRAVEAPVYSHLTYDNRAGGKGRRRPAGHPDRRGSQRPAAGAPRQQRTRQCLRLGFLRLLDLSRRREDDLERWYVDRFMRLRETSFRDPRSYFKKYASSTRARRKARPSPSGARSISPICTRTCCRPASAPTSSSPRARSTASRMSSCANFDWSRGVPRGPWGARL